MLWQAQALAGRVFQSAKATDCGVKSSLKHEHAYSKYIFLLHMHKNDLGWAVVTVLRSYSVKLKRLNLWLLATSLWWNILLRGEFFGALDVNFEHDMCSTVVYIRFSEVIYLMIRAWLRLISEFFRIVNSCCAAWTKHRLSLWVNMESHKDNGAQQSYKRGADERIRWSPLAARGDAAKKAPFKHVWSLHIKQPKSLCIATKH